MSAGTDIMNEPRMRETSSEGVAQKTTGRIHGPSHAANLVGDEAAADTTAPFPIQVQ